MEPTDDPNFQPPPASRPLESGSPLEGVQKQLREIQARFQQFSVEVGARLSILEDHAVHQRKLVVGTQVTLLFLLLGICLFVGVQMRTVRAQLNMQRPAMVQVIQQFEGKVEPNLERLISQLQDFAALHPDFAPILEWHRPALAPYFSSLRPVLDVPSPMPANGVPAAP